MVDKIGIFIGAVCWAIAMQTSSHAQSSPQFECSYQTTGTIIRRYGNLNLGDSVSVDWEFRIQGEGNTIPIKTVGETVTGEIIISHPSEGTLSYEIEQVLLNNSELSDSVTFAYGNPQGQLGGLDPEMSVQNLITLSFANNNQTTGISDILTSQNYPLDVSTFNRFPSSGMQLSQAIVAANVFLRPGIISGGCTQLLGEQIYVDVRPQSYPNIIRLNNARFLVAIPGSAGSEGFFDTIDKASFHIQGVPAVGVRRGLSDLTTITDELVIDEAVCQTGLADGQEDLIAVWDTAPIIALYPDAEEGEQVPITIQGNLIDGTPIFGNDFIVIDR